MTQVIVYEIDGNQVVMTPVLDGEITIEQVAEKDVPAGIVWRVVEESALPPVDLDAVKAMLILQVDADAERARLAHITGGAGQAMSYLQKAAEAKACLADAGPDAAAYPLLAAEIGITAPTLGEVAQVVAAAHAAWTVIGAQIEASRLGAKAAIAAATDAATAEAAAQIDWP